MRLWAWLVQGYSILAENGMAGMTSPYGVTNLSHARWSVIPRIHAVLYLAGFEIPASPQTQNHVSPQDYCWVITLITLTRDQSALLSMFRVDSMTSIITYFSQGFSTPVEAPRAQMGQSHWDPKTNGMLANGVNSIILNTPSLPEMMCINPQKSLLKMIEFTTQRNQTDCCLKY